MHLKDQLVQQALQPTARQYVSPATTAGVQTSTTPASAAVVQANTAAVNANGPKLKLGFEVDFGQYDAVLRLSDAGDDYSRYLGTSLEEGLNYAWRACCGKHGRPAGNAAALKDQIEQLCEIIRVFKSCYADKQPPIRSKGETAASDISEELAKCREKVSTAKQALHDVLSKPWSGDSKDHESFAAYRTDVERAVDRALRALDH